MGDTMAYLKDENTIVIDGTCLVKDCGRKVGSRDNITCDYHLDEMRKKFQRLRKSLEK
jgi:hypothetical protein